MDLQVQENSGPSLRLWAIIMLWLLHNWEEELQQETRSLFLLSHPCVTGLEWNHSDFQQKEDIFRQLLFVVPFAISFADYVTIFLTVQSVHPKSIN